MNRFYSFACPSLRAYNEIKIYCTSSLLYCFATYTILSIGKIILQYMISLFNLVPQNVGKHHFWAVSALCFLMKYVNWLK